MLRASTHSKSLPRVSTAGGHANITSVNPHSREIFLEQRAGGRWFSLCEDGSECEVGKVLSWEPPGRLLLAWQINAAWQYDPEFVTEVEVTFTAIGVDRTEVVLEHRDLERFGEKAEELRRMIGSASGWGKIMDEFAKRSEAV